MCFQLYLTNSDYFICNLATLALREHIRVSGRTIIMAESFQHVRSVKRNLEPALEPAPHPTSEKMFRFPC